MLRFASTIFDKLLLLFIIAVIIENAVAGI